MTNVIDLRIHFLNNFLFMANQNYGYAYYSRVTTPSRPTALADYTGFTPSAAPSLYRSPRSSVIPCPHFTRGNGLNGQNQEVLHNHEIEMCGMCAGPMSNHYEDCSRYSDSPFGDYVHDYYQYGNSNHIVPYVDYAGHHNEDPLTKEDEWDSMYSLGDYGDQDFYWADDRETECTSVLPGASGYRYNKKDNFFNKVTYEEGHVPTVKFKDGSVKKFKVVTTPYEPSTRNAYIEGFGGFASSKLVDFAISEKADKALINVYTKDGILRIGGLQLFPSHTISPTGDVWTVIEARCGNKACLKPNGDGSYSQRSILIEGFDFTRGMMEDFVLSLIRHGNNHCASWFQTREYAKATRRTLEVSTKEGTNFVSQTRVLTPWSIEVPKHKTFYKVHASDCNISHCDDSAFCTSRLAIA